jgi:lysozyme family protein
VTFDEAFDKLIDHEGGYVNDPKDPGGETKFGISKRQYPTLDIARSSRVTTRS